MKDHEYKKVLSKITYGYVEERCIHCQMIRFNHTYDESGWHFMTKDGCLYTNSDYPIVNDCDLAQVDLVLGS